MIQSNQRQPLSVVIKYFQQLICPNKNQFFSTHSKFIPAFDCDHINELVQKLKQQCFVFTTGKTFAWRIQVLQNNELINLARSKKADQFVIHTDHSFAKSPPQFFALYCEIPDKLEGGKSQIILLDQVLCFLTSQQIEQLLQTLFPFRIPEQFVEFNNYQTINYLPILYKQDEQINIRWREQVIATNLLNEQQLKLLKTISSAIKKVKPFEFSLQEKQCLIINNGKFLHARTQIKDPKRLLYRIMFDVDPKIKGKIKTESQIANQNHEGQLKRYIEKFAQQLNQKDSLAISQDFFCLQTLKLDSSFAKIQKLKTMLNSFYKTIVKLYSQQNNIGASLRSMLNWPTEVNNLIEQMNKKMPYEVGFYRPDIVFQEVQKNLFTPKICQVNIRYALNAFIISLQLQKLSFPQQQINSPKKIQEIVLSKFKHQKLIHFITNSEKSWDPLLLKSMIKPLGIQMKWIKTTDIQTKISNNQIQKLLDSDGEEIKCVIFQLKQEEFIELAKNKFQILHFLVFNTNTLNDFRSIFIAHDKRLLALFNQKSPLYKTLQLNHLFHAQMSILKKYVIPTFIVSQNMLGDKNIIQNKDHWVIKAPHKGKGVDMIFGNEVTKEEWVQSIKQRMGWILQKFTKPLNVPIICREKTETSSKFNVKGFHTVSTFLCYNDQFLGIGFTRASQNKKVALSCNGVALPTLIENPNTKQKNYNYYEKIQNVQIHTAAHIRKICEQKYQKQIVKMSKLDLLKYNENNQISEKWRSSYISPSGGSSNNFCYVTNQIDQNHFLRKKLGQEFQDNKVIQKTDICMIVQTSLNLYRSRQIFTQFCEVVGATAIPLDHQESNQTILNLMNYFNTNVFISSPSRLISFCKFIENNQKTLPVIKKIIYGGQILYDNQKLLVRQVFPFAEFFSVYGSAQSGVWAYTRRGFQQNHIFSYPSQIYQLQIQQPNQEGIGKLLVTSLIRTKTPIYRFQMGQYAKIINSNTFQLIARPSVVKFRLLFVDFQVQQFHQILKSAQKWQIILQNIPEPKITFKIKVNKNGQDQFLVFRNKILEFLLLKFKQDSGVENQQDYKNLVKVFQDVQDARQFIKCIPSNKHYYIVDRRLK